MAYTCFEISRDGHVTRIQLNRPNELNTMTRAFWRELPEALREIDAAASARVVVLSSTGKHFTAGMDLGVFAGNGVTAPGTKEPGRLREAVRRTVLELQDSFNAIERIRMPVLAAVQGGCIGGGVDMVTACDMRYCSADAFFCVQEINIGMTADVGTLQRLQHVVPSGIAREMAYTGARMPAERAREVGLVNDVFPDHDALIEGVMKVAHEIASRSPLAIAGTKEMLNYARDHSVADSLNYIATWQTGMFQAQDMLESFAAKQEKRDPVFEDLLPHRKFDET